jgi:hypothetical protein
MKEAEFIDIGFKPKLVPIADSNLLRYVEEWEFPVIGQPAPTLNGNKAAVWIAGARLDENEVPIVAVSTETNKKLNIMDKTWFAGVIEIEYLDDSPDTNLNALNSAIHGPHNMYSAFQFLSCLLPIKK